MNKFKISWFILRQEFKYNGSSELSASVRSAVNAGNNTQRQFRVQLNGSRCYSIDSALTFTGIKHIMSSQAIQESSARRDLTHQYIQSKQTLNRWPDCISTPQRQPPLL